MKRLRLSHVTIRHLGTVEIARARGGAPMISDIIGGCTYTHNTTDLCHTQTEPDPTSRSNWCGE